MAEYSIAVRALIDKCRRSMAMTIIDDGSDSDYISKQVLTDEEIYDSLETACDDFNLWPPYIVDYTVDTLISANRAYGKMLIHGAQIYALILLEFYEAGAHFSTTDDGHSITRDRFANYAALKNQLWGMYEKQMSTRKQQMALTNLHIRGIFSSLAAVPFFAYKGNRAIHGGLYSLRRRGMR